MPSARVLTLRAGPVSRPSGSRFARYRGAPFLEPPETKKADFLAELVSRSLAADGPRQPFVDNDGLTFRLGHGERELRGAHIPALRRFHQCRALSKSV